MGSLILPGSGPIYLDAAGFIYSVEKIEPYCTMLEPLWKQAQAGQFEIISSELVLLEILVKPFRENDTVIEESFRALLNSREVRLIPATRQHWEQTARLRASTGLKTPDALHAVTALAAGCTLFLTNDRCCQRVSGLSVIILDDLKS
jgi:predicted nucleic acid-binding protein